MPAISAARLRLTSPLRNMPDRTVARSSRSNKVALLFLLMRLNFYQTSAVKASWLGRFLRVPVNFELGFDLLDIDEESLLLAFQEADLWPMHPVHPKRLLKALR